MDLLNSFGRSQESKDPESPNTENRQTINCSSELTASPDSGSSCTSMSSLDDLRRSIEPDLQSDIEALPYNYERHLSEQSQLLSSNRIGVYGDRQRAEKPSISSTQTSNTSRGWKVLKMKVADGELLLRSSLTSSAGGISGKRRGSISTSREEEVQTIQDNIRNGLDFSVYQCLIAIGLYLGIAVFAFSFVFDRWPIIDSMYFAVCTFTTLGYGDLVPMTKAGRVFTAFFALSGVACLGIALGIIGNNIITSQRKAAEQSSKLAKHQVVSLFSSQRRLNMQQRTQQIAAESKEQQKNKKSRMVVTEVVAVAAFVLFFVILVEKDPGIDAANWAEVFYFAIITACTIGYGDLAPKSSLGRAMAIVFIPLAVGATGHVLSIVANWIIDGRQKQFRDELATRELTLKDLDIMDADRDGRVSRAEFLEFMLVAMNKVDQELLDELKEHFQRLDKDNSGSLNRADLISVAKEKLQSPSRKLELASYKETLLRQAEARSARRDRHSSLSTFWESSSMGIDVADEDIFS